MATYFVDAATVTAFGQELVEVADQLAAQPESAAADSWAFGQGRSAEAFCDLMEHWRRARLQLASALADLGESAQVAGDLFVETEEKVTHSLGAGGAG